MDKSKKRVLVCTFIALSCGLFGSYFGGQLSFIAHTSECQNQPQQGFLNFVSSSWCRAWMTPVALWKGSTTGLWTGTILGAFIGGIATRHKDENSSSLPQEGRRTERMISASDLPFATLESLTPEQTEALHRFLVLLTAEGKKSTGQPTTQAIAADSGLLSVAQFQQWLVAAAQLQPDSPTLTLTQARSLLQQFGFSEAAIDAAHLALSANEQGKTQHNSSPQ